MAVHMASLPTRSQSLELRHPPTHPPSEATKSRLPTPHTAPPLRSISDLSEQIGVMQESATASPNREQESQMKSTDKDKDESARQPSINTEPRTLNEMNMERAMITAEKIYAKHPSENFTKDAVDAATRENAPAEDAGDANSLGKGDLFQKAGDVVDPNFTQFEAPAAPPPSPSPSS